MTFLRFLPLLFLPACTLIPTPHGTAQFWGDYANVSLTDGPVSFHADRMTHSSVVRAHWHGATAFGGEAAGAAIGLKGGQEAYGAAVTIISNATHRPTTRATP